MALVSCVQCEGNELRVDHRDDGPYIVCESCAATWRRDAERRCATCGGGGLISRPRPLVQYSRGTQLSIVGWVDLECCPMCDTDALAKSVRAGGRLPPDYEPAAVVEPTPTRTPNARPNPKEQP